MSDKVKMSRSPKHELTVWIKQPGPLAEDARVRLRVAKVVFTEWDDRAKIELQGMLVRGPGQFGARTIVYKLGGYKVGDNDLTTAPEWVLDILAEAGEMRPKEFVHGT